jgi:hypothetical protein
MSYWCIHYQPQQKICTFRLSSSPYYYRVATHTKSKSPIDNLYSPIYFGDLNVHEGKQFWITCQAEKPIKWHKDGEPIETGFVRQGDEEFTYSTRINERADLRGKFESTLNVSHAVLRHRGKYQCNINHESAHILQVDALKVAKPDESERDEKNLGIFEPDDDHEDSSQNFEDFLEEDRPAASTMMHSSAVTQSSKSFDMDDKSHETPFDNYDSEDDLTSEMELTTKSSVTTSESSFPTLSFTNSPILTTHETIQLNNAIHKFPSEVDKQDHLDKHLKGSQNTRKEKN